MPQKRRTRGGRVTPSKKAQATGPVAGTRRTARTSTEHRADVDADEVTASSRYTPRRPTFRRRPRWHRVAGWVGVALGLLLAVLNDAMLFTEGSTLLPFGHQELYLILAVLVAGGSTWFLGLFDRGTTVFD